MSTSEPLLLRMEAISKAFPGVQALQRVDFELAAGEVMVLLGENGAGKSTLIKIMTGAYIKDAGRIYVSGREVSIQNPKNAQDLGIGAVYQEFNLVPNLSVMENLYMGRYPANKLGSVDWGQMHDEATRILHELDVDIDPETGVSELGVAYQQMVEIAKCLLLNARIIIMDEPTSALTSHEIDELFRAIGRLKERGVGVIYISHRLEEVFRIGDRATVLRDGGLVGTVEVRKTDTDSLIRMMVGRDLHDKFPKQTVSLGDDALRVVGLDRKGDLHDINFHVRQGEVLGIAGLVGSGRTELCRAVFGADPIDRGEIYVQGRRVQIRAPRDAIRAGIGFLTEDRKRQGLVLGEPIKHNVSLPILRLLSRLGLIQKQDERGLVEQYVRDLRIKTPTIMQPAQYLSGGNQQKVVLAKWLSARSKVLFFDEPTRGIDVGAKVEVYELMNQLTSEGVGIVMVSSEIGRAHV
jgi:ribose transport system ATP-binding protein